MSEQVAIEAPDGSSAPPESRSAKPSKVTKPLSITGRIGGIFLLLIVIVAFGAPFLAADPITKGSLVIEGCGDGSGLPLYDPIKCNDTEALTALINDEESESEFTHILGVNNNGLDLFSQLIFGARTSIIIAVCSVGAAMAVGGTLGVLAGYFRDSVRLGVGRASVGVGTAIGFLFDVMLAYPALVLAISLIGVLGKSVPIIILTVGIVAVPLIGRIARASTLTWAEREFVLAAAAMGATHRRIIRRDLLPNVLPAMFSIAFLAVGIVLVTEGALSVLNLGVPTDQDISWGTVLAQGSGILAEYPQVTLSASLLITLTVMALNLLGDGIREKFDVKEGLL